MNDKTKLEMKFGSFAPETALFEMLRSYGFALGLGLFWFEEHAALVFQKFAHETQRSTQLQTEIDKQRVEIVQLSAHISCLSVAARAVESALLTADPIRAGLEEDLRPQLYASGSGAISRGISWNSNTFIFDLGLARVLAPARKQLRAKTLSINAHGFQSQPNGEQIRARYFLTPLSEPF